MAPLIKYQLKGRATPGPNCLFQINRPDLGFVGTGYIFDVLVQSCMNWRRANGWPIGLEFEDELEQAICQQHPDICKSDDPRAPLLPRTLGLQQVILGTQVMVKFMKSGFKVVDRAEAERRAAICAGCKYNVRHTMGCGGGLCGALLELVKRYASQGTSKDNVLHACQICGCRLQVAVWIPQATQWEPMSEYTKTQFREHAPANCWKLLTPASGVQ